MTDDWLQHLQPGDEVIVAYGFGRESYSLRSVTRLTPTQIVVGNEKYRRGNGALVTSDRWSRKRLTQPTDDRKAQIRQESAVNELRHYNWQALDPAVLFQIVALLPVKKIGD